MHQISDQHNDFIAFFIPSLLFAAHPKIAAFLFLNYLNIIAQFFIKIVFGANGF